MTDPPAAPGIDPKTLKTWIPDEAEYAKVFASWTEDWNKIYGYRQ
jgi:iron(III) transport system substrate-binding protein